LAELCIENVDKYFGKNQVLADISMNIGKGEFVSILGPSGCGKTTLLKLIAGLEMPTNGSIYIGGKNCYNIPARNRGAVIVFQDYGLFPHMTVRQNVEFGLEVRKASRIERAEKFSYIAEVMQIADKAGNYPRELSGGQKQRVALARACVLEPNLLLLDEPFSNLDSGLKDVMREFVLNMQRKLGITTLLVTHDKEEAFMLSHRVAVILDGRIRQFDQPQEIYCRPASMQVANFVGEANYVEGNLSAGKFSCIFGNFDANAIASNEACLMLRWDHLHISREKNEGWVPCSILEKIFKGRTTTYRVITNNSSAQCELRLNSADGSLLPGENAYIKAAEGAGHILPKAEFSAKKNHDGGKSNGY